MPKPDVAVTGLGMVTPAGTELTEIWRTLRAGRATARHDPRLTGLPVTLSCRVTGFDPEEELGGQLSRRLDRFTQLALAAAQRAVTDAKLDPGAWPSARVGVVLGVGSNSLDGYAQEFRRLDQGHPRGISPYAMPRSLPNMAAGEVAIRLGAHGPNFVTNSACASGATAIGVARDLVRSGTCDVVLTGGSESGCVPMTAASFAQLKVLSRETDQPERACRPFGEGRDGFVLGEGAAVLVLESAAFARSRNAPVRARLRGYGASADAHHTASPHPQGRGAEQAVRSALADAGCLPRHIQHVNAHGTGTQLGDTVEAAMLHRVFGTEASEKGRAAGQLGDETDGGRGDRGPTHSHVYPPLPDLRSSPTGAPSDVPSAPGQVPPVTAVKGVTGHALGASGAIEAATTVLTLQEQAVPPTAGIDRPDPALGLDVVTGTARTVPMEAALTSSFGFGGQNAALVFTVA
jgi:3-oxoacyl-[acyl-carrier-protein] synthase II